MVFWQLFLSVLFVQSYAVEKPKEDKLTCNELANMSTFSYAKIVGNWNVVFAYAESGLYSCRNLTVSLITADDIKSWMDISNDSSTVPIVWNSLKLRVKIYKESGLFQDFALQETHYPGRMYVAKVPDFFKYHDLMDKGNRYPVQLNVVRDYLISISCRYFDVNVHSRGRPHASKVLRAVERMRIPWRSGRPVCVPGSVEALNSTKTGADTNKDNKLNKKTVNVEL